MSSPQTYTQTILVDCNRFSSVEYNASKLSNVDNARFTNKVSDGITLDIGDQVSIANAHIAQRGAGGSVIEFRGTILGKKNISYTKTTNTSYIGYSDEYADGQDQQPPTGYAYETSENIEEEVDIKDNEITMVAEYYKNANGENYITLPRSFGNYASAQDNNVSGIPNYINYIPQAGTTSASYWAEPDGYPLGCINYFPNASHLFTEDYRVEAFGFNASGADARLLKLKNDNSRYTLFKQSEIVWSHDYVSSASNVAYLSGSESSGIPYEFAPKPDPALHKYIRLKQKVKLSVPVGYNSPSNIAATITDELTQTEDPIIIPYGAEDGQGNTSRREGGTGQLVNATLHKAFPSVNFRNFNGWGNKAFFNASQTASPSDQIINVGASSVNNVSATNYLNSYAYVGFKRPDFVETGRDAFPYSGAIINEVILQASSTEAVIHTDILWTDENLIKISRFFDKQKKLYRELIDGGLTDDRSNYPTYNTTSSSLSASFRDVARFIHGQVFTGVLPDTSVLGSDLYNLGNATLATTRDTTSFPLFIYFNENSSATTASQTNGDTYDNLAYGFARKHTLTVLGAEVDYIAFTTEKIGGINIKYFEGSDISSARIGYDYHFSAYGNAAIIPSTGYFPLQYYGHQRFQGADYIRHSYIGADNPLFNFDTVENRFELSNLHTSEKVGNFYNAGDPIEHDKKLGDLQNVLAPPPADQAGSDCYKMNKQLDYATWSPSMFPYSVITTNVSATDGSAIGTGFIEPNKNLDISTTFDSRSGVIISDAGVDEANFDQSLWGLLGYKYSQFNVSGDDIKNSNTRFTNVITNVSGITTNANIISTDPVNYPANAFATQLFTSQANSGILYFNDSQMPVPRSGSLSVSNASETIAPPTTITAVSTSIKAFALPRKLLRGYFTLHSDILDQTGFYHNANPMSIMASVGKYNAASDFITYDGGGPVFTVTRKKTITSITSQINDPEGSISQVGDNSGIVYRVDKIIKADLNFATNLMAGVYGKQQQ